MSELIPSANSTIAFLGLLLGFGFVIFVHELGHFLVAKWVGIKVTQFAIGFGQSILTWRQGLGFRVGSTEKEFNEKIATHAAEALSQSADADADSPTELTPQQAEASRVALGLGETEYRLNWMPLGGYVKMLGQEDLDPTASSDDPRSFTAKPVWARACVVSAGVVMNLIFAMIFFIICFLKGVDFPPAIAGLIEPGMPAATTYAQGHEGDLSYLGLQPGDVITHVDDEPLDDFLGLAVGVALAAPDTPLKLTVKRPGHDQPLVFFIQPVERTRGGMLAAGVGRPIKPKVAVIHEGGALWETGVAPDMIVTEVAGQKVDSYGEIARLFREARGQSVPVKFEPDPTDRPTDKKEEKPSGPVTVELTAVGELARTADRKPHLIGIVPATLIGRVTPGGAADTAGVKPGDLVADLDGHAWPTFSELSKIVEAAGPRAIAMTVLRDGETIKLPAMKARGRGLKGMLGMGRRLIGVSGRAHTDEPIIGAVLPDSPVAELGLNGGSRITKINEQPVANWSDIQRLLQLAAADAKGETFEVSLTYQLNVKDDPESTQQVAIDPHADHSLLAARWRDPIGESLYLRREPVVASNAYGAAVLGIKKTHEFMLQTYVTLLRLFQGTVPFSEMRGPVGIVQIGTQTAQQGWSYLLFFLGVISVNLVVINFLPIPVVDGGLMVFLIIEKIKGSPVGPRVQTAATLAGLALILCVFLVVTFNDLGRLITG